MSDVVMGEIIDLVNDLWIKTYDGEPTYDIRAVKARIVGIFDDRNCWAEAAKANQKEYLRLEKQLKKLKNEKGGIMPFCDVKTVPL